MYLVVSVGPSVRPFADYQSEVFVCVSNNQADAVNLLLIYMGVHTINGNEHQPNVHQGRKGHKLVVHTGQTHEFQGRIQDFLWEVAEPQKWG